jgi:hypothetical protein
MPNRIIKESIKRSPQIDSLTWFEEVVFYRLMVTADDYGCVDGRVVVLKNDLFPTKETVTKKAVEDAINKMVSVGLVYRYVVDGIPYLYLTTWEKHQRIRNKNRRYPEPPEKCLSADCCQMTADCQYESNPIQSESESKYEYECADKPQRNRFVPPTIDEIKAYCIERDNSVDADKWHSYYTANGWKVGKNQMKDWRAAVRTWEQKTDKPKSQYQDVGDLPEGWR